MTPSATASPRRPRAAVRPRIQEDRTEPLPKHVDHPRPAPADNWRSLPVESWHSLLEDTFAEPGDEPIGFVHNGFHVGDEHRFRPVEEFPPRHIAPSTTTSRSSMTSTPTAVAPTVRGVRPTREASRATAITGRAPRSGVAQIPTTGRATDVTGSPTPKRVVPRLRLPSARGTLPAPPDRSARPAGSRSTSRRARSQPRTARG